MSLQTAYVKHNRPVQRTGLNRTAISPQTCLIKSGAAHDPPSLGSLPSSARREFRTHVAPGRLLSALAFRHTASVRSGLWRGGIPQEGRWRDATTQRLRLPSRSRQARPLLAIRCTPSSDSAAISLISSWESIIVASTSNHNPQSKSAQLVTAITPSSYGFAFRLHSRYFSLQTAFRVEGL